MPTHTSLTPDELDARAQEILRKVWGFGQYRPGQQEIVRSVLAGQDTLAVLPTGAGKSICFQLPALVQGNLCLVVSPLIALMLDQVARLRKQGIKAFAIHAGMHRIEIGSVFEAVLSPEDGRPVHFLYLSPERLLDEVVQERLLHMGIGLIAVDEAHCISEWGHEFRPSYRRLAELRELLPGVPVIALTATATPEVVKDITSQLAFRPGHSVFEGGFVRANLSLSTFCVEDKVAKLVSILAGVPGSSIIYLRSRQGTAELSETLRRMGLSVDYIHAGVPVQTRTSRQEKWRTGKLRIVVATTAFGMGVDKADVRSVIHMDLPESLEAYYQEVGRAGRDGERAYGVLLYTAADIDRARLRIDAAYPANDFIRRVYQALGSYLQIPYQGGALVSHEFDIERFTRTYPLPGRPLMGALARLEQAGLIELSDGFHQPPRMRFLVEMGDLYDFQLRHIAVEPLIKMLLRVYGGGLFSDYLPVQEEGLAYNLGMAAPALRTQITFLVQNGILDYKPATDKPQLTLLTGRYEPDELPLAAQDWPAQKARHQARAEALIAYVEEIMACRMVKLVAYFGQALEARCGHCDNCIKLRKLPSPGSLPLDKVLAVLAASGGKMRPAALARALYPTRQEIIFDSLRLLTDQGKITLAEGSVLLANNLG